MTDNRLHDEFDRAARRAAPTSTGIDTIVDTARRRTGRRRAITATGGALALGVTTVVGIQQLSRVDDASVPLDTPPPAASAVESEGAPTSVAAVKATTAPNGWAPAGVERPAILDVAVPATASEPVMTWTVIDADSPEALALRFDTSNQQYALATEPSQPGQAGVPFLSRGLWERGDDGWTQIASDVLPGGLRQAAVSGDAIYAVGTEPATADGPAGAVGRYDISAGEWSLLPLPADIAPYRSEAVRTSTEMSIAPIDGGALVAISRWGAYVDWQLLDEVLGGSPGMGEPQWVDGALAVPANCDHAAMNQAFESARTEEEMLSIPLEHCESVRLSADQLGLTPADIDQLEAPRSSTLWRFDGSTLTPVDPPAADTSHLRLSGRILSAGDGPSSRTWAVGADGEFTELFADIGAGVSSSPPTLVNGFAAVGVHSAVATAASGGPTRLVDLLPAVTDDDTIAPALWVSSVVATADATVAVGNLEFSSADAITETTSFTDSGYELVVDPEGSITVIDQSTGQPLDRNGGYWFTTEPGAVRLRVPSGGVDQTSTTSIVGDQDQTTTTTAVVAGTVPPPTTDPDFAGTEGVVLAEFEVDPATLPPWSRSHATLIMSSTDGTSYDSIDVGELVAPGGDESPLGLSPVGMVDGRFVIRAISWTETGPGRAVYLVGTPNG